MRITGRNSIPTEKKKRTNERASSLHEIKKRKRTSRERNRKSSRKLPRFDRKMNLKTKNLAHCLNTFVYQSICKVIVHVYKENYLNLSVYKENYYLKNLTNYFKF